MLYFINSMKSNKSKKTSIVRCYFGKKTRLCQEIKTSLIKCLEINTLHEEILEIGLETSYCKIFNCAQCLSSLHLDFI